MREILVSLNDKTSNALHDLRLRFDIEDEDIINFAISWLNDFVKGKDRKLPADREYINTTINVDNTMYYKQLYMGLNIDDDQALERICGELGLSKQGCLRRIIHDVDEYISEGVFEL